MFPPTISTSENKASAEEAIVRIGKWELPLHLRRSRRARRVSIVLGFDKTLTLVLPPQVLLTNVESLVQSKAAWILRRLDAMRTLSQGPRLEVVDGAKLIVDGEESVLRIECSPTIRPRVVFTDGALLVSSPRTDDRTIHSVLRRWFMAQARQRIPLHVARLVEVHKQRYSGVTVRDQRTRWGSCSSRTSLSFNWRLILVPAHVRDYLIIHELAHLSEMNHSSRFWNTVGRMCPDYRSAEKWLKTSGHVLPL